MFKKQTANPQAVMHAQARMEQVINDFESREFSATQGNATVTLLGSRKLKSVTSTDQGPVETHDVETAFARVDVELEHQRNVKLVQIRNEVQKKFRVDIKSMVPDIAAAVTYMSEQQSKAS